MQVTSCSNGVFSRAQHAVHVNTFCVSYQFHLQNDDIPFQFVNADTSKFQPTMSKSCIYPISCIINTPMFC